MIRFPDPIYVTRPILPPLDAVTKRLAEVWASGWLTNNGQQQVRLEAALRGYLGVPHLALFNNGTAALMTAVRALDLSGEVITTPFTFPATPHVLAWSGITPVFADVEAARLTLDPRRVEEAITPQTTGILAVHVYGWPCDVEGLQQVANRHGLKLVYDGAHVFGATMNGLGIGTFGDITMFSFHATKLFHTAEGGALACRDADLLGKIGRLRNFGILDPETVDCVGLNGKMSELQASVGLAVLDYLHEEIAKRKALFELYQRLLGNVAGITVLTGPAGVERNYQYCVIRVDEDRFGCSRNAVHDELHRHNVISRKYFFPLCSDYTCYRHLPSADSSRLPIARAAANEVLCLPLYGTLAPDAVEGICEIVATRKGCAV
ncbi:MAG TPA: DegT/DnrJ/EryC1/StrS family aminotransferase [Vicinamibacterales bacterium]|jgi:dTDP-4-amino-4,6-dideoxygalactose transaminase|nr:DegT/DnrJ/EryC1/StrS family aminotransferase [Vicinamibacterales bacterium]